MKMCGVYKITAGEWFYIGSSKDIERRTQYHREKLAAGKHKNKLLQKAFDECGKFEWQQIVDCSEDDRFVQEQLMLDAHWHLPNRTNISPQTLIDDPSVLSKAIADSTKIAYRLRPELGQAISRRNIADWADPERRAERASAIRNANAAPERREKIAQSLREHWSNVQNRADQAEAQERAWTEDKRQEHSKTMQKAWDNEETHAKAAESAREKWKDESYVENQKKKQSSSWQDPVVRAKRIAGMKAAKEKRKQNQ